MIDWGLIAAGMAIGVAVSAPLGPINLLVIRHSISHGLMAGVFAGLGSVLGDGTFAAAAAFSLTAFAGNLLSWVASLQILAALLLILMGVRTILIVPDFTVLSHKPPLSRYIITLCTTYFLTITNPATMMGFAAFFGGYGGLITQPAAYGAATTIVIAVMAGSLAWWVIVAYTMVYFKDRITAARLGLINKITGFLILGFGLYIAARALAEIMHWGS